MKSEWRVAEAKAKLSEVMDRARKTGPQTITRRGRVVARRDAKGRPIHAMGALIAATADVYELTLGTRNESDFRASVKSLLNPWT